MLIQSRFIERGDLEMKAYTFDLREFSALENTLARAGIAPTYRRIPNDRANREGRAYTIRATELPQLEALLEGRFQPNGLFLSSPGTGTNYRCKEVNLSGGGPGCEDIIAPNKSIAQTKCALIARKNNWFGGVPSAGQCP